MVVSEYVLQVEGKTNKTLQQITWKAAGKVPIGKVATVFHRVYPGESTIISLQITLYTTGTMTNFPELT